MTSKTFIDPLQFRNSNLLLPYQSFLVALRSGFPKYIVPGHLFYWIIYLTNQLSTATFTIYKLLCHEPSDINQSVTNNFLKSHHWELPNDSSLIHLSATHIRTASTPYSRSRCYSLQRNEANENKLQSPNPSLHYIIISKGYSWQKQHHHRPPVLSFAHMSMCSSLNHLIFNLNVSQAMYVAISCTIVSLQY